MSGKGDTPRPNERREVTFPTNTGAEMTVQAVSLDGGPWYYIATTGPELLQPTTPDGQPIKISCAGETPNFSPIVIDPREALRRRNLQQASDAMDRAGMPPYVLPCTDTN